MIVVVLEQLSAFDAYNQKGKPTS